MQCALLQWTPLWGNQGVPDIRILGCVLVHRGLVNHIYRLGLGQVLPCMWRGGLWNWFYNQLAASVGMLRHELYGHIS